MHLVTMKTVARDSRVATTVRRAAAVAACISSAATAATDLPRFAMEAVLDAPGGRQIAERQYSAAAELLSGTDDSSRLSSSVERHTNLCVLQTVMDRQDAAIDSCSRAIDNASRWPGQYETGAQHNDRLAVLYSNRAVASWQAGHAVEAEADLATAMKYAPKSAQVTANAAAFAARRAMAAALND